jgi:hypothetical protein
MNILLFFIPMFWTGPPIPFPDCVEPVGNDSVILHADPLVPGCGLEEAYQNMYYYMRELNYRVVNQSEDFAGASSDKVPGTLTMEKKK